MAFSVHKTIIYALGMFVGLAVVLTLLNTQWPIGMSLAFATVGAIGVGVVVGFTMRDAKLEVAGATLDSVDAAMAAAWALRGFRARAFDGGVEYRRGFSIFSDRFAVFETATGVRLEGPFNIIRLVKTKAAG